MKKLIIIALASTLHPCFADPQPNQTLRRLESELSDAQWEIDQINDRERKKQLDAEKAERERLLNLPLDQDLMAVVTNFYVSIRKVSDSGYKTKEIEKVRIKMAKLQEQRNLLR